MVNWRLCRLVCMWGHEVSGNKEISQNQVMLYNAKEHQVKVWSH